MSSTDTHPVEINLDAELWDRVKRLADASHQTPTGLMREAIDQFVAREERRKDLRRDALRAWQDYQATGLQVSAEEADAWLEKLEEGQDLEPPLARI